MAPRPSGPAAHPLGYVRTSWANGARWSSSAVDVKLPANQARPLALTSSPARPCATMPQATRAQPVSRSGIHAPGRLQPYEAASAASPTPTATPTSEVSAHARPKRCTGELPLREEAERARGVDARAVGRDFAARDEHDLRRIGRLGEPLRD